MKFSHRAMTSHSRGAIRLYCRCGKQWGGLASIEEAGEVYVAHLKEAGINHEERKPVTSHKEG